MIFRFAWKPFWITCLFNAGKELRILLKFTPSLITANGAEQ